MLYTRRESKEMLPQMLHRFDLHVHSFYSGDGASSPEQLIEAAQARGLSGIAITDHNTCEAHAYLAGRTLPPGFLVVPGVEVSTAEGHLLCIGTVLPNMKGAPASVVAAAITAAGGIAIPAHPFDRWRAGIRAEVLETLPVHTIETFNSAVTSRAFNAQAAAYAQERGLHPFAASDAHHASAVGSSTTAYDLDSLTLPALLAAMGRGGTPDGHYLTFREGIKKHFANWFRKFNPRPKTTG